jgi:hypothetical protein
MLVRHVSFAGKITVPQSEQDKFERELEGKTYSSEAALTQRVINFWGEFGFMRARTHMESQVTRVNGQGVADIVFKMDEGDQYRLAQVSSSGEIAFTPAELSAMFLMKPGEVVDKTKIGRAAGVLRGAYVDRGYSHTVVVPQVQFNQTEPTIALTFDVIAGARDSIDVRTVECKSVLDPLPPGSADVPFVAIHTYDPHRDGLRDAQDAILEAARSHRNVLLEVGGDWCVWCHILEQTFQDHLQLVQMRDENFVTVFVNDDGQNRNEDLFSRLPSMPDAPHLFVLDGKGNLLLSQTVAEFEQGRGYSATRIEAFLRQWSPQNSSRKCSPTPQSVKPARH